MKKFIKLIIISLSAWLLWLVTQSFAADSTTGTNYEQTALTQIKTYFQELAGKFNKWEITQEKVAENLRNRIFILKEMYWDKISEDFYNKMLNMAENLKKSKDEIIKLAKSLAWTWDIQQTAIQIDAKTKASIDALMVKYFQKIEKLNKDKKLETLQKLVSKIEVMIKWVEKDIKKKKISTMLNYLKQLINNKLSEIRK